MGDPGSPHKHSRKASPGKSFLLLFLEFQEVGLDLIQIHLNQKIKRDVIPL
jgi:hypothetical protein